MTHFSVFAERDLFGAEPFDPFSCGAGDFPPDIQSKLDEMQVTTVLHGFWWLCAHSWNTCLPYSENVFHKAHTNAQTNSYFWPFLLWAYLLIFWAPPGTNRVSCTNEGFLSSVTKMVWELLPRKGMRELKKRAEPLRSLNLHCSNLHHVNVASSSLQLASLCFFSALGRLRFFWGHGNFLLPLKTTLWHPGAITLLRID